VGLDIDPQLDILPPLLDGLVVGEAPLGHVLLEIAEHPSRLIDRRHLFHDFSYGD